MNAEANWLSENSHLITTIGRVAYDTYKCRFPLKTSSTITELENCNILATKNDPPASNTAATLSVLIYAITPAIRCATLNQQSTLNFIPKTPSVMHHLDCIVTCAADSRVLSLIVIAARNDGDVNIVNCINKTICFVYTT